MRQVLLMFTTFVGAIGRFHIAVHGLEWACHGVNAVGTLQNEAMGRTVGAFNLNFFLSPIHSDL